MPTPTSEFDFLSQLPKPKLDDRSFEDLVEECLLRIPRYCPEWTNYNPGDPGVTLIELFAWLVHQMLYRFNQVPRQHYVAFLELLGIRLQPPAHARTELTFYLTRALSESHPGNQPAARTEARPMAQTISQGTEVATVRTETQEAIIFTTDRDLTIGVPRIRHLLLAHEAIELEASAHLDLADLDSDSLDNPFRYTLPEQNGDWSELAATTLLRSCQPGNCFYLVIDAAPNSQLEGANGAALNDISGNVLALTFKGPIAVTTGINPNNPPLDWQVWDGRTWRSGILRVASDDKTRGFSFDQLGRSGPNPEQEGADVVLHLPQQWPQTAWGRYHGRWIRCVYTMPNPDRQQFEYQRSPEITGLSIRTVGGVVAASECVQMTEELLGISNGKPGQVFQLSRKPILQRRAGEQIEVRLPNDGRENWEEKPDFGESGPTDRHYTIDNTLGTVQFGPLIREPHQLRQQTQERSQVQSWGRPLRVRQSLTTLPQADSSIPAVLEAADRQPERQYGKVPTVGAEIYMKAYRVGGGSQGNVKARQLTVLKSSIPYVKQVINYAEANGGREAESLEEAMIRVPALLRTRETALTPEEFEQKARQFRDGGLVYRSHCITAEHLTTPGVARLLIIPTVPHYQQLSFEQGLSPEALQLSQGFSRELKAHLDRHRALGIRVSVEAPEYIGIKVRAQVYLQRQYSREGDRARIATQLKTALYRFLNPIVGGLEHEGWPLGRTVERSDIIALLQQMPEVHSIAQVDLFLISPYRHRDETRWMQIPTPMAKVELGALAVATSWNEGSELRSGHDIEFLEF